MAVAHTDSSLAVMKNEKFSAAHKPVAVCVAAAAEQVYAQASTEATAASMESWWAAAAERKPVEASRATAAARNRKAAALYRMAISAAATCCRRRTCMADRESCRARQSVLSARRLRIPSRMLPSFDRRRLAGKR